MTCSTTCSSFRSPTSSHALVFVRWQKHGNVEPLPRTLAHSGSDLISYCKRDVLTELDTHNKEEFWVRPPASLHPERAGKIAITCFQPLALHLKRNWTGPPASSR